MCSHVFAARVNCQRWVRGGGVSGRRGSKVLREGEIDR